MTDAEKERAAIVAWLRSEGLRIGDVPVSETREDYAKIRIAATLSRACEAIERGEHLRDG